VLSVLRFTDSDYPFGIFKLVLSEHKGLRRAKHNTTAVCRQKNVEQVYIKRKSGHNILLDTVNSWT